MRGARGPILILGSLAAIGPLSGDMYLPAFPQLAADLGAPPMRVQLTLTASLLGLAVGQLVIGPLSDHWGRRRPLLAGITMYVVASLGCAFAPSIAVLTGLRFVQGFAGAAAVVLARAIVRDLYSGTAAARAGGAGAAALPRRRGPRRRRSVPARPGVHPQWTGLAAIAPSMFVVVASLGFALPDTTALALARFPDSAGTASSILGALHFAIGASVAPLVGLAGAGTAVPFGAVIAGTGLTAVVVLRVLGPRPARRLTRR